jgi:hypothetical protein
MAKLVLGKTPEQVRAEEAEKQRKLEIEIREHQLERQKKIEAMHKKQKTTKIVFIAIVCAISLSLLGFGTYNTFFKPTLSIDDVTPVIDESINTFRFPSEGLDNYIHDNCEGLFNKYLVNDTKKVDSNVVDTITVDKDSCYISRVKKLSSNIAQVYFSVNVTTKSKDTQVTDPLIIDNLKKNGFNMNLNQKQTIETSNTQTSENDTSENSILENSTSESSILETSEEETSEEETSELENASEESIESSEQSIENNTENSLISVEPIAPATESTDTSNIDDKTYYIDSYGKLMQVGVTTTVRYNFYVPIEFYYVYSGEPDEEGNPTGNVVSGGFRPCGDMTLFTLEQPDISDFTDITYNEVFSISEEFLLDDKITQKIRVKVDNILSDLYLGKDTSQEFYNYRKFNGYNAKYEGIEKIDCYSEKNYLGMNTHVTYKIITSQGFIYKLETWLNVEEDGNSYIIKEML